QEELSFSALSAYKVKIGLRKMNIYFRAGITRRFFLFALPFALGLLFLLPAVASAHSIYSIHAIHTTDVQSVLGNNLAGSSNGSIDGPTLFNLIMITLVEITAVFWVGAQFWLLFVPQLAQSGDNGNNDTKDAH